MIKNKDRRGWIGASDSNYVTGNWTTDTFKKWWASKIGMNFNPHFQNKYTLAGTFIEHAILDTIPGVVKDGVYEIEDLGLRVNFDGEKGDMIYEVKTHKADSPFKVSKTYWRQAQVQMFAKGVDMVTFVSYPLTEEDYTNYFRQIDKSKIRYEVVKRDDAWINNEYLPKLKYISRCIKKGVFPTNEDYLKQTS